MSINRILVAVDGSPNSLMAVEWTASLAAATGAEVVAVHAFGLLERLDDGAPTPAALPHRDDIADQLETVWSAPLTASGVTHRCVLQDGPPVAVVLASADAEDVDLIVLGSRGVGTYPEQLLGSTSTQVAQRSTRPVTIVPHG